MALGKQISTNKMNHFAVVNMLLSHLSFSACIDGLEIGLEHHLVEVLGHFVIILQTTTTNPH